MCATPFLVLVLVALEREDDDEKKVVPEETVLLRQFGVDCSFFVCTHAHNTNTSSLCSNTTHPGDRCGWWAVVLASAKDTDTVWVISFIRFIQGHSEKPKDAQRD